MVDKAGVAVGKDVGEEEGFLDGALVFKGEGVTIKGEVGDGRGQLQNKLHREQYKLLCEAVVVDGGQKPHSGIHWSTT